MAATRRSFLQMALAPTALAALAPRWALGAPAIIKPELTPQQFGATGGDPVADTLGWNRAMAAAAESGRPIMAQGTYVLRVPAKGSWNWRNRADAQTHIAVMLRSGVQVYGKNAEILVGVPEQTPVGKENHFLFGTALNLKPGTLKDIRFEGLNFDFRDEFGPMHRPLYAFGITGVENFQRQNMIIRCSDGKRAGRGLLAENNHNRVDRNLKLLSLEQGIFTHYERGVTMEDIEVDGFNEAFDFDGPSWDVNLRRLKFRNGYREAQCIDTGGGARWTITDIDAEDVGSIVYIYNKSVSWPTYEQWLNADDDQGRERVTPNFVIPEKMTIKSVRGRNIGRGIDGGKGAGKEEALRIGSLRAHGTHADFPGHVVPSPKDITIEDWTLDSCYRIAVNDCENLTMRNVTLNDVKVPNDGVVGAAFVFHEAVADLGGSVTGIVSDIKVNGCEGMGVSVIAGPKLKLQNVRIDHFNQRNSEQTGAAVRVRYRLDGEKAIAQIDRISAENGQPDDVTLDAKVEPVDETPKFKHKMGKNAKPKRDKSGKREKRQKVPADDDQ